MKYDLSFDSSDLTFLTACNNNYVNFVKPFIHFCKSSNPNCKIEIWIDDPTSVNFIEDLNIRIHKLPEGMHPAKYRFLAVPTFKTKHTYITDIDILYTELVQPFHILHMAETGLPFSNVVRNKKGETFRLTGLHFVDTEIWYNDTQRHIPITELKTSKGGDEHILFQKANQAYDLSKASRGLSKRPIHGIHCSVGRNPREPARWELTSQKLAMLNDEICKVGMFNKFFEDNVCRKVIDPSLCDKLAARFPYE